MLTETIKAIEAHALQAYPNEACGLVAVIDGVEGYHPCRNVSESPGEHFRMAKRDYTDIDDRGEITYIVHSHPDEKERPSEGDRVACEHYGVPWYIVSVMPDVSGVPAIAGDAILSPSGYQAPLIGRRFFHGILDCWALCRDWYKQEFDLDLPNPDRADGWWDDGESNLYLDNLEAAGFKIVPEGLNNLKRGDMILMSIRSKNHVPNHAAVYLGDGHIIHHMYGRLSSRDVWGGYWRHNATHVARHTLAP